MPKKLEIFDFDDTLFRSPLNTPENHKKFEKATGIPWLINKEQSRELTKKHRKFIPMRSGWWGRAESLEPPIVPSPAPKEWFNKEVCEAFLKSKADSDTRTLILTGRHAGLKPQVFRILDEGSLVQFEKKKSKDGATHYHPVDPDVTCFLLGDDVPGAICPSPKPSDTYGWKVWVIDQLLEMDIFEPLPEIESLTLWEDRDEHVERFRTQWNQNPLLEVNVIHVKNN